MEKDMSNDVAGSIIGQTVRQTSNGQILHFFHRFHREIMRNVKNKIIVAFLFYMRRND